MAAVDEREQEFSAYMQDIISKGMTGLCVALGSCLGIFDVLCAFKTPQTSETIAEKGNWKPRYIKEWLNSMVSAKIVDYIKDDDTYYIPEFRKPCLSKSGGCKNKAVTSEQLPVMSSVFRELASCYHQGGPRGVSSDNYVGFHEWKSRLENGIVSWDNIYSTLKQLPDVLKHLENGGMVCDGGCSSGHFSINLAKNLPESSVVGFDISTQAINLARDNAKSKRVTNVSFELVDACDLPSEWENRFDLFITINVVHDLPFPQRFLNGIWSSLKPGGAILMVDAYLHSNVADSLKFSHAPWYYAASVFHCLPVSLNEEGAEGLGCTWGIEKQRDMLETARFKDVTLLQTERGNESYYVGYKAK